MPAIPKNRLRETLLFAAHQKPATARAIVRGLALCCAEEGKPRDPDLVKLAEEHYQKRQPVIAAFHATISRQLAYAKAETLRKVEKAFRGKGAMKAAQGDPHGVAWDLVFDPAQWGDDLLASLRDEQEAALGIAGDQLNEELGLADDPWTMPDPKTKEFLRQRENMLAGVPDEIHQSIVDEVQAGLDAGEGLAKISKRITDKFDEIDEGRAMTIADTETSAAYGYARHEGMLAAGITHKRWLTSHLPTVRMAHAEAEANPENQRVPLDEPFHVGGENLMYPSDPAGSPENVINCHCIAIAAEENEP